MVRNCCVCKNKYSKDSDISFHLFPKDELLKKQWMQACKMGDEDFWPTFTLCSDHFTTADFSSAKESKKKALKRDAVPSVFHRKRKKFSKSTVQLSEPYRLIEPVTIIQLTHYKQVNSPELGILTPSINMISDQEDQPHLYISEAHLSSNKDREQISLIPSEYRSHKIYQPSRIGDLTHEHFVTYQERIRNVEMVKTKYRNQQKKIKTLLQQNRRLLKKMNFIKNVLNHLRIKYSTHLQRDCRFRGFVRPRIRRLSNK